MTEQAPSKTELANARKRKAPKLSIDEGGTLNVGVETDDQLRDLYGLKTKEAASGILQNALNSLGVKGEPYRDLMAAMALEMEPSDAIEAMLISQMTATNVALSIATRHFIHSDTLQQSEAHNLAIGRLGRAFCTQVETLKKYRAKAQQTVRVERVTVNEGGQAIVGPVAHGGRANGKK